MGNKKKSLFQGVNVVRIPVENLVLYNRFNNSLVDETGNHTLSGFGTYQYAGGIFSGLLSESWYKTLQNQYITIPDSDLFSFGNGATDSSFSITTGARFLQYSTAGIFDMIINKRGDSPTANPNIYQEWQFCRQVADDKIRFQLFDDSEGAHIRITSSVAVPNDSSTLIGASYNGNGLDTGLKLYINGIEDTSAVRATTGVYIAMENLSAPVAISTRGWGFGIADNFRGLLDGLAMWNKELTPSEMYTVDIKQRISKLELL